jgi:hypothetical protein
MELTFAIVIVGFWITFLLGLFFINLHRKYKASVGTEARRAALKEVVILLQKDGDEILRVAPKGRLYPTLNNKVMVLMHAREKVQYLLDKTR